MAKYFPSLRTIMAVCVAADLHLAQASEGGNITTFASVPAVPGFPEGIVVDGDKIYVSGPARFGTAGTGPSAIHVYDRKTGELKTSIEVSGEFLEVEHALSNIAVDHDGRIYALSTQLGLIRFTKQGHSYIQDSYGAPLPDLPLCSNAVPPCSPTVVDFPPIPNDLLFDEEGFAYVSDSLQATIFRYAPGGGAAQIWFQSPQFEGGGFFPFGTNGMRFDLDRDKLYVAVSTSFAQHDVGRIYRLPVVDTPTQADLEVFHEYPLGELPDQLAFGAHGELCVSLALSNQISVLAANGTEVTRLMSKPDDDIQLDNPAGIAFDSRTKSIMIINHALLSGNPAHFAVLQMFVNNPGNSLNEPPLL